ncbi:MAG TPA: XRE family transcriptional regulator, partial [Gemmatimonadaceae bacterium]|nr:XRE family transcriptional regulator [Gemmatimonadaceae bacterium]
MFDFDDDADPIPALKMQVLDAILYVINRTNQGVAAHALGIDQPRASNLQHRRLERFSLETLIRLVSRLERRVDLKVTVIGRDMPRLFRFPPKPTIPPARPLFQPILRPPFTGEQTRTSEDSLDDPHASTG